MTKSRSAPRRTPAVVTTALLAAATGGMRAGFRNSDPSDANRSLERHELPGNQGA
jgi:hypothetical protein